MLVERAAEGDARAWEEMVTRYDRLLRSVARSMRVRPCDADDAAQLTWLALGENIRTLRHPENLAGWLRVVMRRRCLAVLQEQRREVLDEHLEERQLVEVDASASASQLPADTVAIVWQHVDRLPARERVVLRTLFDGTDRSYREIARTLAMPVGSVGPVRMRALKRLAAQLDAAGLGSEELIGTA